MDYLSQEASDMETYMALRGATTVDGDYPLKMDKAVAELMAELYSKNSLEEEDIAYILFSQTHDLRMRNAATSCRLGGFSDNVPIFCVQEADVAGGLRHAVRVLIVLKKERAGKPHMVYLREAAKLRPDYKEER